jgi:hypothetical protein
VAFLSSDCSDSPAFGSLVIYDGTIRMNRKNIWHRQIVQGSLLNSHHTHGRRKLRGERIRQGKSRACDWMSGPGRSRSARGSRDHLKRQRPAPTILYPHQLPHRHDAQPHFPHFPCMALYSAPCEGHGQCGRKNRRHQGFYVASRAGRIYKLSTNRGQSCRRPRQVLLLF